MDPENPNRILLAARNNYLSWSYVANSYIGSWISLTSNSEIRYEGFLYRFNPDDSTVVLSNVRCFGTEGRKMDGTQIPPIEMVYEYIIFRGTDMKDFQVKYSPPIQSRQNFYNNTDGIQSQYPCLQTISTNLSSIVSGSLIDINSNTTQLGVQWSNFQGSMPSYQLGGNLGSSEASPYSTNSTVTNKAPYESTSIVALPASLPLLIPLSPTGVGSSDSICRATPPPGLVTTGHLFHPRPSIVHSPQSSQTPPKHGRLVEVSSTSSLEPSLEISPKTQQQKFPSRIASGPRHMLSFIGQDNSPHNEMTIHSENVKIDTEAFGGFTRYHGWRAEGMSNGRGGRGRSYGRRGRYGWYGRGRGHSMPYRGGY